MAKKYSQIKIYSADQTAMRQAYETRVSHALPLTVFFFLEKKNTLKTFFGGEGSRKKFVLQIY